MDTLILLTYAAIVITGFKVFKVPVNGYTVVTAALGGVAILSTLLLLMNYNHPYTQVARFYFHTTPIVPQVGGKVTEVFVTDAQHVMAGDPLFQINPIPYQNTVKQKQAQLEAAKKRVDSVKLELVAAEQSYKAAQSQRDAAKDAYDRDTELLKNSAVSELEFEQAKQSYLAAEARTNQAKADLDRAKLATQTTINGVDTQVAEIESQLATALFELDETTVRAPTDGRVLQVMLRPGMMALPMPLKPSIIFQHDEEPFFVASFLQNSAQRISEGNEVEVILPSVPGRFFRGKVQTLGAAIAAGQLQPSGQLLEASGKQGDGRINVLVQFDEGELDGYQILPGSTGHAAIYSEHMHHLSIMRRVLLRMKSWTNYLFSDGH